MIPYVHLTILSIGPLTIHVWGLFVSLGFILGVVLARRAARGRGLDDGHVIAMTGWVVFAALIGARLGHVFLYEPSYYLAHPLEVLEFWKGGMASFGGYIGGTIATLIYLRRHALPILQWADVLIMAIPASITVGRIGPFLGHLHPGIRSTLFFAVQYPESSRLDADLLLALNGLILAGIFALLARRTHREGFFLTFFLFWYGSTRFVLDAIRATDIPLPDARYFGLTPAQYGAITFVMIGLILIAITKYQNPNVKPPPLAGSRQNAG